MPRLVVELRKAWELSLNRVSKSANGTTMRAVVKTPTSVQRIAACPGIVDI
jgi:hypothetical protein